MALSRLERISLLLLWALLAVSGETEILFYPVQGRLMLNPRELQQSGYGQQELLVPPTTEIVLNGGEYRTYSRTDGSFMFHDVRPGVYLLDVLSTSHFFSQVKLNLPNDAGSAVRCLEYKFPGAPKQSIDYPLKLMSHARKQYFEQRETIGLHTMLRNPMLVMGALTGVLVLVMPKLMENMDPDEVKKMQEQMGAAQDPASFMKHMFGVGADADDDAAPIEDEVAPKRNKIRE